jgi:hypothetical protein
VATLRKVGHDTIHTDAVLVSRVARHVCPIPFERHGHLPEVLWHVVECLVELSHGHGAEVVDTVDVNARGIRKTALLLKHRGSHAGRSILTHVGVGLQRGVCKVRREWERLQKLAWVTHASRLNTYLVETVEVGVEDHAW